MGKELAFAILGALLLLGAWLCGYLFFRRFRTRHHARWLAAGQPRMAAGSYQDITERFLPRKTKWNRLAAEIGDTVLARLVVFWTILEWAFLAFVVVVSLLIVL
jgi:hypothetical protein